MLENKLQRKYKFSSLMKYALPSTLMMIFLSLYTIVDGMFVARFVGPDALASVNIIFPLLSVVFATAIMLSAGSSAICAKYMGEGKDLESKQIFSSIFIIILVIAGLFMVFGLIFTEEIALLLGADENIHLQYCIDYGKMIVGFAPFGMLQVFFQSAFIIAGKPTIGLVSIVAGGITNIVLDYVLIEVVGMGIAGAGLATGLGWAVPSIVGIIYFFFKRNGTHYFVKPKFYRKEIFKSLSNGSSEMITNLSIAFSTLLINLYFTRNDDSDGLAAFAIVLYMQFFLQALYFGYISGIGPIVSFKHGEKDFTQQKTIFKSSIIFILISSVFVFVMSEALAPYLVMIFLDKGDAVYEISKRAFYLFSISYLFSGINIFASGYFTFFSNGKISATLSILRAFVFVLLFYVILTETMPVDGIWLVIPFAEMISVFASAFCLYRYRNRYGYSLSKKDNINFSRELNN